MSTNRNKKKFYLLVLIMMSVLSSHAQHFDWLKSYYGIAPSNKPYNLIRQSASDSQGNLYVLGPFAFAATIDEEDICPIVPYGEGIGPVNMNTVLFKISPEGQILWKKVLHGNNHSSFCPFQLRLVGDSTLYIAAMGETTRKTDTSIYGFDEHYTYYFDTLITASTTSYLPSTMETVGSAFSTIMAQFDLDGNLLEHHFLHVGFIDTNDRIITSDRTGLNPKDSIMINCVPYKVGAFCVDKDGNMYLGNLSADMTVIYDNPFDTGTYYSIENGMLSGIVILVDGIARFRIYPQNNPESDNYRILKFSPHFDTLLHCQYIFENTPQNMPTSDIQYGTAGVMVTDSSGNLYYCNTVTGTPAEEDCYIKDAPSMAFHTYGYRTGFLIKYDSTLTPIFLKQFDYGELPENTENYLRGSLFFTLTIDEDSSSIFISSTIDSPINEPFYIDSTEIYLQKNAMMLRLEKESGQFVSYGYAPSTNQTLQQSRFAEYAILCNNNRVFIPVSFITDISCQDQTVTREDYMIGEGLYIWDYQGHPLQYIDYNVTHRSNCEPSTSLCITDSILYISGGTTYDMQLGDFPLPSNGNMVAYFAKYVDKSFDTVYSAFNEPAISIEYPVLPSFNIFPNPTTSVVQLAPPDNEFIIDCHLISANGIRQTIPLSTGSLNLSNYPSGIYFIEINTDKNTYRQKIVKQ